MLTLLVNNIILLKNNNFERKTCLHFFLILNFKDRIEATNSDSPGLLRSRWKIVKRPRFNEFYCIQSIKIKLHLNDIIRFANHEGDLLQVIAGSRS